MAASDIQPLDTPHLLARIRDGDRDALAVLYEHLYTPLWRLTARILTAPELAEEVVQDVFLALWQRRGTLQDDDDIRAYLYATVRNRALNVIKHQRIVTDPARRGEMLAQGTLVPTPDYHAESREFLIAYHRALSTLTERDRTALQLRWEDELTYEQIGQVFGMSTVGARALVLRAQAKVQELLAPYRA